jgi:hypothetical protein
MSIVLPAWIAVPLIQAGQINPIEAAPFVLLCRPGWMWPGDFSVACRRDEHALGSSGGKECPLSALPHQKTVREDF